MYYLYILYSSSSDIYYSGISDSPFIRLEVHNTSHRKTFTSKHRPWKMVALFECSSDLGTARKIENFIKGNKSRSLLEWLIDPKNIPSGVLAQLVRVPHMRD
jgi:putative endonuclease